MQTELVLLIPSWEALLQCDKLKALPRVCTICVIFMSVCVLVVQEITVEENNRTQIWCHVPFVLPSDIQIVWRYAEVRKVILL